MNKTSLALLFVLGCGAARPPAEQEQTSAIEAVRARAAAHPNDPDAQRALAEWELFGDDGDADRAEPALSALSRLAPGDVAASYMRGVLHEQRGRGSEAADAFVAVLRDAPRSDDPLASFYAESAMAYLYDLRDSARDIVDRARPAIEAYAAAPGNTGTAPRRAARFWLHDVALARGDTDGVARWEAALGCPTALRVAGPFGPLVLAPFDRTLPAEGAGPLADRYELGPGRGERATEQIVARRCAAHLGEGVSSGSGTRIVEAQILAPARARYVLALATAASVRISIDGRAVSAIDRRRTMTGFVTYHAFDLAAGEHELELKVTTRDGSPELGWSLDHAEEGYTPETGLEPPADPSTPLALFVVADALSVRGAVIEARELLRTSVSERSSAALLSLAARVASLDPHVPESRRADDERRLVALATARDPRAHWPAWRAALLASDVNESLAAMGEVAARFPQLVGLELQLASALAEEGYAADADLAIGRAMRALPDSCGVIRARFEALLDRGRVEDATPLAARLVACDARDRSVLDLAIGRRDYDAARAELARLAPLIDGDQHRAILLRIARATGDRAAEERLVAEIEAEGAPGEHVIREVDRLYGASDRARAIRTLEAEAARAPREAADLRRVSYALSGRDVMEPYRVDGREALARFLASGRTYDGYAAVLVFDYMVTRIFEDGSAIDLVHQIFRIQTQEGVERFGSLSLGGRVLTVRVLGPDGAAREPDAIAASTQMPPVSVGDYVEFEIVRDHEPRWGDGYVSNNWVFQNFSQPFDHSEMVYVAPIGMDVRFDVRGPVPPPETRDEDGLRTYRFVMEEQRALEREPNALDDPPILPSLRAGTRVTWDRMFESVYDLLLDTDRADPAVHRLLRTEILGGEAIAPRERVRRIHRWVMEHIDEVEDSFFAAAPLMITARRGDRSRVLRYLLELAEIPARIAFARDLAGERPNAEVPDTSVYSATLVVADVQGQPLYLIAGGRGVPHDFLPPSLRGQDAVVLAEGLPHVTLPVAQGPAPSVRFEGDVEIDPRGAARVELTVAFAGEAAAELRTAISQLPAAERARILAERFAPSMVPGAIADPDAVRIGGLDDWEEELTLRLEIESDGLVRSDASALFVLPLFMSGVEANYAELPRRTTTELVGELDVSVSLRVRGPGVIHPPEPGVVRGPAGASASLEVAREGDAIRMQRRVRVPLAAIPVAQYEELARFCRATTQLEQRTVVFTAR
jgi:hypothetical protein